jgi:hypothetical protein
VAPLSRISTRSIWDSNPGVSTTVPRQDHPLVCGGARTTRHNSIRIQLLRVFYTHTSFIKILWSAAVQLINLNATSEFSWSDTDSPRACKWLVAMIYYETYNVAAIIIITGYVHVVNVSQAGAMFFRATFSGFVVLVTYRPVWLYTRHLRRSIFPARSADPIMCCATVPLVPIDPPSQSAPNHRNQDRRLQQGNE